MTNPYAVPPDVPTQKGVFARFANRIRGGFLFREIDFEQPFAGRLKYDGWWFRQKITINGRTAWFKISWLSIHREAEFRLPAEIHADQPLCRMEIDFSRGLSIRRFRIWIDDLIVYDEIN